MPIRSITDLRKQVGPDWNDVSDEDLISSYAKSIQADPAAVAYQLGFGLEEGGKNSKRLSSSVDRYQAGLYGVGEELTKAVGLDSASAFLGKQRRANELRAETDSLRAQQLGAVDSFKDVNSVSDFGDYAVGLGIQSLPYLGEALVGGIGARALMGGTRAALSTARATGDVAAATKAKRALDLGSTAGAVGASYPSAVGDVLSSQREQAGQTDPLSAFALGVPYAAANAFGLEGAAARSTLFRNTINLLDKPSGLTGAATRAAATGVTTGLKEGASETFQEGMNQLGRMVVDPTENFFSDAAQERFKESFIGGAVLGGGTASALGGWRRSQPVNEVQQVFNDTNTGTTPAPDITTTAPATTVAPPAPTAPAVSGGTTDIAQATAAAQQEQAQTDAALQQQAAREQVFEQFGIASPQDPTKGQFFGQKLFGPAVNQFADATITATQQMTPVQQELARAVTFANAETGNQLVKFAFNAADPAKTVAKAFDAVNKVLTKFQIGHVQTAEEAGQILNTLSENAKGQQLEQINALHVALTGEDTSGFLAVQNATTKGAKNGQLQVQNPAGVGTVREQGAAGSQAQGNDGAVQPSGVQSVNAGSQPEGSLGLQVGQPSGEGVRDGSGGVPVSVDGGGVVPQAPQVTTEVQDGQATPAQTVGTGQAAVQPAGAATDGPGVQEPAGDAPAATEAAAEEVTDDSEKLADQMESITDEVMKLLIKPTSRMDEATAQKQRDFIFTLLVNGPYDTLAVMAQDFGIKPSQAKDWSAKAAKIKEDPTQIAAAFTAVAEQRGLTINELMARVEAKAQRSINATVEVDQSISTSREQGGPKDSDERKLREEFDAEKGEAGEREVTDEGLAIKGRKSGESLQERFNAVETNQAKFLRLSQQLLEAEDRGDQAEIDRLNAELEAVLAKGVEQSDKRTKKGQAKAEPVVKRELDSAEMAAAAERFKAVKGDLTQLTDDELAGVKARAAKFNNKDLVGKVDAELAKRGGTDAVQESSTAEVDARERASDGQAVGEGNAQGQAAAEGEGKTELAIRTPQEQYEALTEGFPVPAFADLPKLAQDQVTDLANRDQLNLAAVNRILSQAPKALTNEPVTIDVEARVVEETVGKQVAQLPAPQINRLEKHYGLRAGSSEFLAKVKEDVVLYATKGAEAVAAAIRDIIKAVHAGVLSVAMIFNPNFVTPPQVVILDEQVMTETRDVRAEVPANVKARMSEGAKEVYSVLYPSIKGQLQSQDKLMVIVDKPNARMFIFKPDGSLLLDKKVLLGAAKGDLYKGNNDVKANRITPAGLFTMGLRDAARGGGEAKTAGGYDFEKVFVLDKAIEGEYSVTLFHSVWTKEADAQQRLNALKNDSAADSRYSFGCINVDKETYGSLVKNHLSQMDGAALFIVPESSADTAEFLKGATAQNKSGADGLTRTTFTPATETVTTRTTIPAASTTTRLAGAFGREEDPRGGMKFGKGTDRTKVKNPYTAKELLAELKDFMRADIPGRKLLVVDSVEDLLKNPSADIRAVARALADAGAFGVAVDGRAYLIANRIEKGRGRAKFMHEVGAHLGLEQLLPKALYDKLTAQIVAWAKKGDDSIESQLALNAAERVMNAGTPKEDQKSEMLAYFIEEAIQAGIDPTADVKNSSALREWFRTLWAAFKVAIRKLGFNPDKLQAVDVVNMAFGAARLEIAGTWHGTAADFRRFSNKFMGTGEGAQAYGWGTYLAQRYGIARGYWEADIGRKAGSPALQRIREYLTNGSPKAVASLEKLAEKLKEADPAKLAERGASLKSVLGVLGSMPYGMNYHQYLLDAVKKEMREFKLTPAKAIDKIFSTPKLPEGNIMAVDTAVPEDGLLDWGQRLKDQPRVLEKLAFGLHIQLQDAIAEQYEQNPEDLGDLTGEELYNALRYLESSQGLVSEVWGTDEYVGQDAQKVASLYLNDMGIGGIKFLDAKSRGAPGVVTVDGQNAWDIVHPDAWVALMNSRGDLGGAIDDIADQLDERGELFGEGIAADNLKEALADLKGLRGKDIQFNEKRITNNLVIFDDKNIFRVGARVGASGQRMKFGVESAVNRLPQPLQQPTRTVTTNTWAGVKKVGLALAITEDVVKLAQQTMKSAADYLKAQYAQQATRLQFELGVEKILQQYDKLPKNLQGTGESSANRLIFDMTTEGKWGFTPSYNSNVKLDAAMVARFNSMPASAQKLIRDVFEHGHNALVAKQTAVKAAADKVFKEREANAQGDQKELAEIGLERKAFEEKFKRILKLKDDKPYAYLGRYGNYVAVAKSNEFLEAEKLSAEGDLDATKWLKENESNPDHYMVSFAETQAEADRIAANWQGSGKFEQTYAAEKMDSSAYVGGGDLFLAFKRMENMITRKAKGDLISGATLDGMRKLLADMYLATVAESSAHTSSLARKNISGADMDMMRNLATRGRADAHFLAALKHGDDITDSMDRMIDERKQNPREATPVLNELLKRQAQSMEYKLPGTLAQNMTQLSTVYFLSTNPAFYMQQILQTAVLSLPFMAGRLGYFRSVRAIQQAYGDMRQLVKGLGVNDHVDFDKAPADVRAMLQTLVGMGKIDIGIDSDAKARSSDQSVMSKVMRKLQGVNTRVETINRAVAAMAAYRAYKQKNPGASDAAAVQYASDVVSNTHGSYDGFNTPRALSSDVGRVIGQFKRFQIIQLSMLGKLIHTAFKGASPDEKAVARASLRFITAHMAVLGGALGVPFVSQLGNILVNVLGDDDEPKDLEQKLRDLIGNEAVATLLLRGVPASVGLESLGKKVSMENVASLLPFTDLKLADREGLTAVYVALLGPSAALSLKFADGLGMMRKGEYYKGLEMLVPNGVSNVMKAYRFADQGVTMRNGDTVIGPDGISMVDAAFQAVGLPTTTITDRQRVQTVVAEANKFYEDRASQIKRDYTRAFKDGDSGGMQDARNAWMEMQDARSRNGFSRQPLSTLFRAPMEQQKRERNTEEGVQFNRNNRAFVERVTQ